MSEKEWMRTGHRVCYVPTKFNDRTLAVIESVNEIIHEYESRGFAMTLRQVYYQLVARGKIENTKNSYDGIGDIVSRGRIAGLISWTAIEDRGRNLMGHQTFRTPQHAIKWLVEDHYRIDMWENQPWRPEVWVEKAAQEVTVGTICDKLRVNYFSCRGYNSQSEQWRAGRRFAGYVAKGQRPIVFHLGDHDPSGIDMTRDNKERLELFAGVPIQVVRLALNMPQVNEHNPPPNPTKFKDPRAGDYIREHGHSSWELDALDPILIQNLIEDAVLGIRDRKTWEEALLLEAEHKMTLESMVEEMGSHATEEE